MEEKRFTLRMNGELFVEISDYANKHRRSTAKEIEYAIAKYLFEIHRKELLKKYKETSPDTRNSNESFSDLLALEEKYGLADYGLSENLD